MTLQNEIAHAMLKVGAVELNPTELFTWASGIKSPIYCDTRLTISDPVIRKQLANGLASVIKENFGATEIVAGTATAGIPHAAWVSDILELPMVYVRSKAKEHGRGNQIEGKYAAGQKVVVVEDIVSTGGSSITAVEALRAAGCEVLGVVCVYTYNLPRAEQAFDEAGIQYVSLTNFDYLIEAANESGAIKEEDIPFLKEWHGKLKAGEL
ncbi:orotate phosphoribosyltransferase [Lysinibacillus sp. FSL K6-0057]|uniref:Orotate phosphoribosyltransferase n=1 Tax=Lysinibacillus boronitolerans JCM 21713 = 10a = NBRC 103108 TaxID=1294264 RepID=A0ABR4Y119_9BACI|nr:MULTISPECIES: orotate phosphoribosyltransferase [Lysinibacillus]KGR86352.1 Orotate phosphoribosyltransferase [Lysinibacillus boronitolerans JCM 21713 = 10a = NBRC 103108]MCS1391572.1 orotate phosphoribosyltransferase [Lysinibacillus boronitolerans]MCS5502267.1 orotate phosphoribosyltransferase [Lysinibacillus sp. A4]QSB08153.1 orotate phosphoribosyltransferase [Lysinibacillus fusiformis]UKJ46299.1 orotate phosphoribosyltransferase [Lysinibacillus sp. ACHW1.5]